MNRITLNGTDRRTILTLDIDPEKVTVLGDNALETGMPAWWTAEGDERDTHTALDLVHAWYHHLDNDLKGVGVTIVEVTEDGVPLRRGDRGDKDVAVLGTDAPSSAGA